MVRVRFGRRGGNDSACGLSIECRVHPADGLILEHGLERHRRGGSTDHSPTQLRVTVKRRSPYTRGPCVLSAVTLKGTSFAVHVTHSRSGEETLSEEGSEGSRGRDRER
jgi:hypothetical protein